MTAIAANYPTNHHVRFPWLLALVLAAVVVGTLYSHAIARHAQDAVNARRCFDERGNSQRWYNPFRDNYVLVCVEGDNLYLRVVRRIRGKLEELTSYRKDGYHTLEDLGKYLDDQGAVMEWARP
jgi:hypothetical protein